MQFEARGTMLCPSAGAGAVPKRGPSACAAVKQQSRGQRQLDGSTILRQTSGLAMGAAEQEHVSSREARQQPLTPAFWAQDVLVGHPDVSQQQPSSPSNWRQGTLSGQPGHRDRQLTLRIKACTTWQQLQELLHTNAPHMNTIHVSALITQLPKTHPPSPGPRASSGMHAARKEEAHADNRAEHARFDRFLGQLSNLVLTRCDSLDARGIANVLWAVAQLGFRPSPDLLNRLLFMAYVKMDQFNPQELSNLAWALATMQASPRSVWLQRLVTHLQLRLPSFKPQELAISAWALSRLGLPKAASPPAPEAAAAVAEATTLTQSEGTAAAVAAEEEATSTAGRCPVPVPVTRTGADSGAGAGHSGPGAWADSNTTTSAALAMEPALVPPTPPLAEASASCEAVVAFSVHEAPTRGAKERGAASSAGNAIGGARSPVAAPPRDSLVRGLCLGGLRLLGSFQPGELLILLSALYRLFGSEGVRSGDGQNNRSASGTAAAAAAEEEEEEEGSDAPATAADFGDACGGGASVGAGGYGFGAEPLGRAGRRWRACPEAVRLLDASCDWLLSRAGQLSPQDTSTWLYLLAKLQYRPETGPAPASRPAPQVVYRSLAYGNKTNTPWGANSGTEGRTPCPVPAGPGSSPAPSSSGQAGAQVSPAPPGSGAPPAPGSPEGSLSSRVGITSVAPLCMSAGEAASQPLDGRVANSIVPFSRAPSRQGLSWQPAPSGAAAGGTVPPPFSSSPAQQPHQNDTPSPTPRHSSLDPSSITPSHTTAFPLNPSPSPRRSSPTDPDRFYAALLTRHASNLSHFPARHLSGVAWAVARLGLRPPQPWLHHLLALSAVRMSSMNATDLCTLGWAVYRLCDPSHAAAAPQAAQRRPASYPPNASPQALTGALPLPSESSVHPASRRTPSAAPPAHRPCPSLLADWGQRYLHYTAAQIPVCGTAELSCLARVVGGLGLAPGQGWVRTFCAASEPRLSRMRGLEAALLLKGLAQALAAASAAPAALATPAAPDAPDAPGYPGHLGRPGQPGLEGAARHCSVPGTSAPRAALPPSPASPPAWAGPAASLSPRFVRLAVTSVLQDHSSSSQRSPRPGPAPPASSQGHTAVGSESSAPGSSHHGLRSSGLHSGPGSQCGGDTVTLIARMGSRQAKPGSSGASATSLSLVAALLALDMLHGLPSASTTVGSWQSATAPAPAPVPLQQQGNRLEQAQMLQTLLHGASLVPLHGTPLHGAPLASLHGAPLVPLHGAQQASLHGALFAALAAQAPAMHHSLVLQLLASWAKQAQPSPGQQTHATYSPAQVLAGQGQAPAAAPLAARPPAALLRQLLMRLGPHLPSLTPRQLARFLCHLAQLRFRPPDAYLTAVARQLASRLVVGLRQATDARGANGSSAAAAAAVAAPACSSIRRAARKREAVKVLGVAAWAMAALAYRPPPALAQVFSQCVAHCLLQPLGTGYDLGMPTPLASTLPGDSGHEQRPGQQRNQRMAQRQQRQQQQQQQRLLGPVPLSSKRALAVVRMLTQLGVQPKGRLRTLLVAALLRRPDETPAPVLLELLYGLVVRGRAQLFPRGWRAVLERGVLPRLGELSGPQLQQLVRCLWVDRFRYSCPRAVHSALVGEVQARLQVHGAGRRPATARDEGTAHLPAWQQALRELQALEPKARLCVRRMPSSCGWRRRPRLLNPAKP